MATQDPASANLIPVPTLSTSNFVYDQASRFDTLIAHLFAADSGQSYLFKGRVSSFAQFVKDGGSKRETQQEALQQGFYNYLRGYLDNLTVDVTIINDSARTGALDMKISASYTDSGLGTTQIREVRTINKILQQIISLNNYGN